MWSEAVHWMYLALRPPRRCRPKSTSACVLPRTTQQKLQNDLQMAAICAGLRGAQVWPSYEPRSAAANARLWAT